MKTIPICTLLILAFGVFSCEKEDAIDNELEEELQNKMVIGTTVFDITDVAVSERPWSDIDENGDPIEAKQVTMVFSTEAIPSTDEDGLWSHFDTDNGTKVLLSITGDGFAAGKFNDANTLDFSGAHKINSENDVEFDGETGELLVERVNEDYSIVYRNSAAGIELSFMGDL